MPISGHASYPSTINDFLAHWAKVDAKLGAGHELVLAGGMDRTWLLSALTNLETARDAVTDLGVDRALNREDLVNLLLRLQGRAVEFNGRVRSDLPGSSFERVLPLVFALGDAEAGVREVLRVVSRIWTKVNAIAPLPTGLVLPFTLRDGYTVALFDADRETLRLAYQGLSASDVDLGLAREDRNDLELEIYAVLKNYRLKVPQTLPVGDALITDLPVLTPAAGHTPDAVPVQVVWDAVAVLAKVTWGESTDADLSHYEVRGVPGENYLADDEAVLATVQPGAAREFSTGFALSAPGLIAGFKVYVLLKTGNEKGSDAVFAHRPA